MPLESAFLRNHRFHPEKPAGSAMKFRALWNSYDWFGRPSTPFILASRTPLNLYGLVIQVEMNGTVKKRFDAQEPAPAGIIEVGRTFEASAGKPPRGLRGDHKIR